MASKQSSYYDDLDGEEIDEEVDIYKYHHLKKLEDQGRERHRDLITMKIVEKKYFNKEQEKILSWSDKEHIRYLHNTDPQKWTYEVLADQFKVDETVIKTIAKAKWLPKKLKLPEEKLGGSKSGFLLKEPAEVSEKEVAGAQKKFSTNRKMSFKEFCVESGSSVATKPTPIKPLSAIENQDTMKPTQEDTLLKYLTGGAKSDKWANQNENLNLRLDEDRTGNTNVYYYDNQHGYQVIQTIKKCVNSRLRNFSLPLLHLAPFRKRKRKE